MSTLTRHLCALTFTVTTAVGSAAYAVEALDCASLNDIERNKTYEADPNIIRQCIQRGWDPPLKWRPDEGKSIARAPGAGGFSVSSRQPPHCPPGAVGADPSITSGMFNFISSISGAFNSIAGVLGSIGGALGSIGGALGSIGGAIGSVGGAISSVGGAIGSVLSGLGLGGGGGVNGSGACGYASNGGMQWADGISINLAGIAAAASASVNGDASSCPVASDTNGTYGQQTAVTSTGSKSLSCGGAVPLSTYFMSAVSSPVGMIATEAGSRNVWIYKAQGNGFSLVGTSTLPSYVCDGNGGWAPIQPPVAQIIPFNSASDSVALKLAQTNSSDVYDPFNPDPDVEPPHYFKVPLSGSNPQIPSGCPSASSYYSTAEGLSAGLTVESATNPGCEGGPAQCGSQPSTPTAVANCDTLTINPGGASCDGKTLFAVLNRPNLVYPPDSTANFTTIQGRTAALAGSGSGARLYVQPDTIMYFGASGGSYKLPEGGMMKLDNGYRFVMNGPATINAAGGLVSLPNGGTIIDSTGAAVQNFNAGSSYAPPAALPYVVKVSRSVELPAGTALPSQPSPFVREPVSAQ